MIYALGILTGLAISILFLLLVSHFRPNIERTINKTASLTKRRGEIIEPPSETEEWVDNLPEK